MTTTFLWACDSDSAVQSESVEAIDAYIMMHHEGYSDLASKKRDPLCKGGLKT